MDKYFAMFLIASSLIGYVAQIYLHGFEYFTKIFATQMSLILGNKYIAIGSALLFGLWIAVPYWLGAMMTVKTMIAFTVLYYGLGGISYLVLKYQGKEITL